MAKSWLTGAPILLAVAKNEVTPAMDIISISFHKFRSSISSTMSVAIPNTFTSPLEIMAVVLPCSAQFIASWHLAISLVIPDIKTYLIPNQPLQSFTQFRYPTTTPTPARLSTPPWSYTPCHLHLYLKYIVVLPFLILILNFIYVHCVRRGQYILWRLQLKMMLWLDQVSFPKSRNCSIPAKMGKEYEQFIYFDRTLQHIMP